MDIRLLRSKMALFGDTNVNLAAALGISASRLSAKINETGGAEFTQGEIRIIRERYKLSNDETDAIFFRIDCLDKTVRKEMSIRYGIQTLMVTRLIVSK